MTSKKAEYILNEYANCYSQKDLENLTEYLDEIKAEAVKEFVGEFERSLINMPQKDINYSNLVEHIDNLAKEKVGDAK